MNSCPRSELPLAAPTDDQVRAAFYEISMRFSVLLQAKLDLDVSAPLHTSIVYFEQSLAEYAKNRPEPETLDGSRVRISAF